jgi:hypothetical protein
VISHAKALAAASKFSPAATRLEGFLSARLICALLALLAASLLFSASASAFTFKETFGSANQPSFSGPEGLAIEQTSEDLLVIDGEANTISRWNPDGTPSEFSALGSNVIDGAAGGADETPEGELFFGSAGEVQIAVDSSGGANDGNIYVPQLVPNEEEEEPTPNVVDIFSSSGEFLGQLTESSEGAFGEPCGIAVDPSGNVYLGDFSGRIHKYEPAANPPENGDNVANFEFASNCTLAAGAGPTDGFLFAAHFLGAVAKLDATTGEEKYEVDAGPTTTLSVDPSSGHVLTAGEVTGAGEGEIAEFDASGESKATELPPPISLVSAPHGIAINGSTGDLYASRDSEAHLEVYSPPSNEFELTINEVGTGSGSVQCDTGSGPEACQATFPKGTVLTIIASADPGSEFGAWSGECDNVTTNECEVEMDADKTVEATFILAGEKTLSISKAGTGTGAVQCEVEGGPAEACAGSYPEGTTVKLKASASPGSEFAGYSGDCTGSSCELTLSANRAVTATFNLIPRALTIAKAGSGTGEVKCEANGGPAEACAASYPNGTSLTVSASPNSGSEFVGFSAGTESAASCSTSPCTFTIEADSSLTATFNLIPRTLTIAKAGSGSGSVKCEANGGPAEACAASYPNGTSVKLSTTVSVGSEFAGFSAGTESAASCSTSPCTFTIEADSSLTATFNLIPRTLTITKAGSGTGEVKCEANGGPAEACAPSYPNGTSVKLKATPGAGSELAGFSGACTGMSCTLSMSANKAVTVTFNLIPRALTIAKAGSGSGTVSCNGGACAPTYPNGASVTLAASAATGSSFAGWSGGGCSGTGACTLTITADTAVTATFDAIPAPAPLPTPAPTPTPKPLKCKKGFKKKKVKGKAKCVRVKKHHRKKR